MKSLLTLLLSLITLQNMSAAEQAFPKTDVNVIEVKMIPAATLIAAGGDKEYFEDNNGLFRPLFSYIQSNSIPMTTPVEAEIDPGVMYFYIGTDHTEKASDSTDEVTVVEFPERQVVSMGLRGSYSEKNFLEAKTALTDWLAQQTEWVADSPARAVYWNGPFTPGPFKRSEVHIPVVRKQGGS